MRIGTDVIVVGGPHEGLQGTVVRLHPDFYPEGLPEGSVAIAVAEFSLPLILQAELLRTS